MQAVGGETAHGKEQAGLVLEDGAALTEWQRTKITAVDVQAVERPEHRRRRDLVRLGIAQEPHVGDQRLVERAHLAVEDERLGRERRDRGGDLRERRGVVCVRAADEASAGPLLIATIRRPSSFSSKTQPGWWNSPARVGIIGSIEDRRVNTRSIVAGSSTAPPFRHSSLPC